MSLPFYLSSFWCIFPYYPTTLSIVQAQPPMFKSLNYFYNWNCFQVMIKFPLLLQHSTTTIIFSLFRCLHDITNLSIVPVRLPTYLLPNYFHHINCLYSTTNIYTFSIYQMLSPYLHYCHCLCFLCVASGIYAFLHFYHWHKCDQSKYIYINYNNNYWSGRWHQQSSVQASTPPLCYHVLCYKYYPIKINYRHHCSFYDASNENPLRFSSSVSTLEYVANILPL